jgi:predicted regulator of Ras-like GTPase activity (Roadblock/LC7/MglB family)
MSMLQGCSELQETVRLVGELLQFNRAVRRAEAPAGPQAGTQGIASPQSAPVSGPAQPQAPTSIQGPTLTPAPTQAPTQALTPAQTPAPAPAKAPVLRLAAVPRLEPPHLAYRGDRLEYALVSLCERGGLSGAVVADGQGLPLADYQSPVGGEVLAAFTSVLGGALERAGQLLGAQGADIISMDLNYTDKIVLRRFALEGEPYFLLVICSQDLDERTEVELSIDQITAILSEN